MVVYEVLAPTDRLTLEGNIFTIFYNLVFLEPTWSRYFSPLGFGPPTYLINPLFALLLYVAVLQGVPEMVQCSGLSICF
jgi:hypothetical protein